MFFYKFAGLFFKMLQSSKSCRQKSKFELVNIKVLHVFSQVIRIPPNFFLKCDDIDHFYQFLEVLPPNT